MTVSDAIRTAAGSDEPLSVSSNLESHFNVNSALFSQILTEMNDYRTGTPKRLDLLRQISEMTGNNVIAYMSNTEQAGAQAGIVRQDCLPLLDLIGRLDKTKGIDLIINSNGGDPDAAEKIVNLCRIWDESFRVIVPHIAKSAATLIALGSDHILMGRVSELGPIDPQITVIAKNGQRKTFAANSYLDSVKKIEDAINNNGGRIPPLYLPYLNSEFEPSFVDYCEKTIVKSQNTAEDWLTRGMLKDNPSKAKEIARKLCDCDRQYLMHGKVIDAEEARSLGLKVGLYENDDPLWNKVWEYYCRAFVMFGTTKDALKVFESPQASIQVGRGTQ